jgi:hypothetical protein
VITVVVAPAGAPPRTVRELELAGVHPPRFAIVAGGLEAFLADRRVATYLGAGRYVTAELVDLADAIMLERRLREGLNIGGPR